MLTPAGSGAASEASEPLSLSFLVQSFQIDGIRGANWIRSEALKVPYFPSSFVALRRPCCVHYASCNLKVMTGCRADATAPLSQRFSKVGTRT